MSDRPPARTGPIPPYGDALRILHVINLGTTGGGAERLLADTVAAQRAAGHQVQVLSSDLPGSGARFNDVAWPQTARSRHWAARLAGQFRNPAALVALTRLLGCFRPDVVHLHTIGLLSPGSLPVLADIPTVLTVHGPEVYIRATVPDCLPRFYFRRADGQRMKLTVRGRLVLVLTHLIAGRRWRRELRVVDVVLAPSRFLATLVSRDLGVTRVVPNGFTPAGPSDQPAPEVGPEHRPRLLFAGRLERFKGPQIIVDAMPAVLAAHPDVHLAICGSGPMEAELRAQIDEHALGDCVELTGWLDAVALQRRFAGADLVIVPSVCPEAFNLSCLEAFAAGVPVVAFDVGGLPDLVRPGSTGLLVPPGDTAGLARAICELLDDGRRRRALGQAAREVHAEFTLDRHVSGLDGAYRDAIDRCHRAAGERRRTRTPTAAHQLWREPSR